jgi:ABC-type branched-subunit amino acid transport system substrate-binding protein
MRWVEKKGWKNVVVLLSDISYNRDVEEVIKERWGKADSPVKVHDFIYYTFGQTELQKELTKAVSYKPDYIWSLAHSHPAETSLMKTLRELNFQGEFSVSTCMNKEVVDNIPKEISEGVYTHMDWAPDPNVPQNKEFVEYWQAQWGPGELPYRTEEVIWAQTVFLLEAMDAAGTAGDGTKEGLQKINDAMHRIKWQGARREPVSLSKEGLGMWKDRPVLQIQNGELKVIEYTPLIPDDWIPGAGQSW